ncbi:HAMP domain-containing histidine kinase [Mucilaginibacter achroorhodeus]|uniref:histidine kinase n=1 Tax=Mucilaginibacter achroorhodeus TaxID=2599294 RepID=A0A563U659_9SPHI|nr:HAMP domain-containing sensor histidine kinase [Mucilaginibacter achroorhodeus]TWR26804.1 HAMP domain-containing histidine kinase [Mucilaginibacter achroorhodeus]
MQIEKILTQSKSSASKVHSSPLPRIGKWEYDVTNSKYTWSEAIFDILDLPYYAKPSNIFSLSSFEEPYKAMLGKAIANACQSGTSWDLELEMMTASNNNIWVRSYGGAVVENGIILKVEGFLMDIDKYRTKEIAFDLLKQKHRQLNTFNQLLTHDLRNHVNNICMLTGMMSKESLDAGNAQLVDKIAQVSENLRFTIDRLSDIIHVKEDLIASEQVNFSDALDNVTALMDIDLRQSEADIQTDFVVPAINFPKVYLNSILSNLISNSIKYKKVDEYPKLFISTYQDEGCDCTILEFQDNGIGIDLEAHGDKIFGLYQTFTDNPKAHGIGLFLVKSQIESQGGDIVVESKPDVGTIFRIFFKNMSDILT